jgi:hypothetical protein
MSEQPWSTREAWLMAAADQLRTSVFAKHDIEIPEFQISVGWPAGKGTRSDTIGQCFNAAWNEQGAPSIFISPVLKDRREILACLAHEMIHAYDDCVNGHRGTFVHVFRLIGMTGKATECLYGDELGTVFTEIVAVLGKYPHGKMSKGGVMAAPKRDTNRQLLLLCPQGVADQLDKREIYKVRTTRKWIDEVGRPLCPCHGQYMEEEG